MKNFTKLFKRCLVCALVILPMIAGAFLLDFAKAKENSSFRTSLLASDPWNGRGSNTIDGTGFNDPGTAGTDLSEPTGTAATRSWAEEFGLNAYASAQFNTLINLLYSDGNYRKDPITGEFWYNIPGYEDIGKSAANPWLISSTKEFVFWARTIQAAYSNSSNMAAAYLARPYFKLSTDISLEGFRWETPRFYYSTTNSYTLTTSATLTANGVDAGTYSNRIYFDGGNKTISDIYVNQTEASGSYLAMPSVFGNIPMKSIIRNVKIDKAFISVPDSVSTNEVSIVAQTSAAECVFDNIHVTDSVIRGNRSMNGIASNASVIINCSVTNVDFVSTPNAGNYELRGIGLAAEFYGNSVINSNLEVINPSFYTWSEGIGKVRVVPVKNDSNGTGYDRNVSGVWTTEAERDGTSGIQFTGGFFGNTVKNTKIGTVGGASYGHAVGVGLVNVAAPVSFIGNTVEKSLISVATDNDGSATSLYACGIAYISNAEYGVEITDNAVISSTVMVSTKQHTPYAFGMFYITADRGAVISDCYTENTDVIARINGATGTAYAYASGICGGWAISFTNCVVGSGNIEARAVGGYIYAYGVGTTFGISSTTGPANRKNWGNDTPDVNGATPNNGANADEHGWWDYTGSKGADNRFTALTYFENCYNFSNITTSTTGPIFAAGIGMGEGFTNCVNYGNVMGNQIGGIAYGFVSDGDGTPGTASGNTATKTGTMHPLIIKNCANYGNLIRAANNQTSYVGGIFSRYEAFRNYRKTRLSNNGLIEVIENIDGKYLKVTNCISGGKIFFYKLKDGSELIYELTDNIDAISLNINFWGVIFGSTNLQAYMFQDNAEISVKTDTFDDFINNRFIMANNNYSVSSAFDFMNLDKIQFTNKFGPGKEDKVDGRNFNVDAANNASGIDYAYNTPTTYWRQTIYGATYSTIVVRPEHAIEGGTAAVNVWSAIVKKWAGSLESYVDYTDINSTVWNTESDVPQLVYDDYSNLDETDDFPFHILAYNRNTAKQGYVPNVSIKKIGDTDDFVIGAFQYAEVGVKVEFWDDRATSTSYEVGVDDVPNVRKDVTAPKAGVLPMTMLFAKNQDIPYSINLGKGTTQGTGAGEYDYIGSTAGPVVKYDPDSVETRNDRLDLTVTFVPSGNPTGVVWEAEKTEGVWREIYTESVTSGAPSYTVTLSRDITEGFIENYAKGNVFEIRARFVQVAIHSITFDVEGIIDTQVDSMSSASLSVNFVPYTDNSDTVKVISGSVITLTASYEKELYDFDKFIIDGEYTVTAGSINSPSVVISVTGNITGLSFDLTPRTYDVVIQTQALASGGMRINLEKDDLILTDKTDLVGMASVGSEIKDLEVEGFYEDVDAKCFYKFVRWEYISGGTIGGGSDNFSNIVLTPELLIKGNNLADTKGGRAFVIVAIFQRQVKLEVDMREEIENMQGFNNNSYTVYLEDGEVPLATRDFGDFTGVIVDENSLIRVEFTPDTRLEVTKIDGESTVNRKDKNVLYLALKEFKHLEVILTARPAKVLVRYNRAHDEQDIAFNGGLGIVEVDVRYAEIGVAFQNSFNIDFHHLANSNLYRIVDLQIKNFLEDRFDSFRTLRGLNLKQSRTITMTADEAFFQNYVSVNGTCEVWLRVAAIYEVNVSVPNFTRLAGTTKYVDAFNKTFEIQFVKNDIPVAIGSITNETGVRETSSGNFIIDHGIQIKYVYSVDFNKFYGLNLSENEQEEKVITVTSTRQIAVSPYMFNLEIKQSGKSKATIDSYTKEFGIGSTITIACTVNASFQINDITFGNGKSLASLGAVRKGNTVTILVTPDFIEAVNSGLNPNVALTMSFTTGISDAIVFGGFGGGALLLLLALLAVFLVIRSKKNTKMRLAAEAKVREYEQKFNIGGMISKLREDPLEYESSMKQGKSVSQLKPKSAPASVSVPKSAPAPAAAPNISQCTILQDRTIVDGNRKKVALMQKDGSIVDVTGKEFAKVNLETGKIMDNAGNVLGTVQEDGSIK